MRFLILLQTLVAIVEIIKAEDRLNTTIILNDPETEMTAEEVKNPRGSPAEKLFDNFSENKSDGNDLDFDYGDDDDDGTVKVGMKNSEQEMQEVLLKAMRKPAIRKQIGEVIPILRVMSPAQRLTLAALVSSQITSQNTLSEENLIEMAAMFANKNVENTDDRHNITEHLLLPISMDIAKMFKGLGKEMGRNLRQNFYRPADYGQAASSVRRVTRKPNFKSQTIISRRMDEEDYSQSEVPSSTDEAIAEALKQPEKDECDYFTISLCLEVSNYPTEAIISSLKKNKNIANTFLTDFEVPPEEGGNDAKNQVNGRRLERRQDDQDKIQQFPTDSGYMCPSSVKYARPKRARTTSGQWKYIVNAGDYTQTLRLEICQKPKSPCSYVTNHLNSQCTQIYNYHRLLTWDETKGLHMDIFKVPSCCSCHIQGYSTFYPPNKDFTFAEKRKEPSEGVDLIPDLQNRPPYTYFGNKREVPKHISNESSFSVTVKNQTQHLLNAKDFYQNPVDHLVPPGPPLPLEGEGTFSPYPESSYNQKKVFPNQNRRYPVQAEYRKTVNKVPAGIDSLKDSPLTSNTRVKASAVSPPERPNLKYTKPHHPEVISGTSLENKQIFATGHQIPFLKASPNSQPSFPNLEIAREKAAGGPVFLTPNSQNDIIFQSGPKANLKQTPQYFKSEFLDTKSLPSAVRPFFVTPPKLKEIESRASSTSGPPQKTELFTSSGQKKINYNYHPIIDFFFSDSRKRQAPDSGPQYPPFASQDWTPVLGH